MHFAEPKLIAEHCEGKLFIYETQWTYRFPNKNLKFNRAQNTWGYIPLLENVVNIQQSVCQV